MSDLFARWGGLWWNSSNEALQVELKLPYPANKDPVMEAHFEAHPDIVYQRNDYPGYGVTCRGRRYPRPQTSWKCNGENAYRFLASIGWECGHPKKDAAMRVWKTFAERGRGLGAGGT